MASDDFFGLLDALLPADEESDDEEGNSKLRETHNSLYDRMNLAVKVLLREKREKEAIQQIVAFFSKFKDLDELEEAVSSAEKLITQPRKAEIEES